MDLNRSSSNECSDLEIINAADINLNFVDAYTSKKNCDDSLSTDNIEIMLELEDDEGGLELNESVSEAELIEEEGKDRDLAYREDINQSEMKDNQEDLSIRMVEQKVAFKNPVLRVPTYIVKKLLTACFFAIVFSFFFTVGYMLVQRPVPVKPATTTEWLKFNEEQIKTIKKIFKSPKKVTSNIFDLDTQRKIDLLKPYRPKSRNNRWMACQHVKLESVNNEQFIISYIIPLPSIDHLKKPRPLVGSVAAHIFSPKENGKSVIDVTENKTFSLSYNEYIYLYEARVQLTTSQNVSLLLSWFKTTYKNSTGYENLHAYCQIPKSIYKKAEKIGKEQKPFIQKLWMFVKENSFEMYERFVDSPQSQACAEMMKKAKSCGPIINAISYHLERISHEVLEKCPRIMVLWLFVINIPFLILGFVLISVIYLTVKLMIFFLFKKRTVE